MLHLSACRLRLLLVCFCSICILGMPGRSRGDIALSFVPIEEAKFLIRGEGWESAAAVDLIVDYDTTYLSAPQVTIMGGGRRDGAAIDATPGRLQLGILNNMHSPNFEVCVFFQKQGEFPMVINFVTAEVTGLAGARQPVPVVMMANPNVPRATPHGEGEK